MPPKRKTRSKILEKEITSSCGTDYCTICGFKSDNFTSDLNSTRTSHSSTPFNRILKRLFAKASMDKEYVATTENQKICQLCFQKIEDCDFAYTNALNIENDLINSLKNKVHNYDDKKESEDQEKIAFEHDEASGEGTVSEFTIQEINKLDSESDDNEQNSNDEETEELEEAQSNIINNYKCELCDKVFRNYILYDIHQNTHMGKSELECRYCSKVSSRKSGAIEHARIHLKINKYQCERCGKQFVHRSSFKFHIFAHDDIRTVSCDVCHRLFRNRTHLKRHMFTHTGQKHHECEYCGKKFAQRYNMEIHKKLHYPEETRFPCSYCEQCFVKRKELDEHVKDSHYEEYLNKKKFYPSKTRTAVYEGQTIYTISNLKSEEDDVLLYDD